MAQSSKITPEFAKAYQALNPEQKEAVDTLDGPVMVVAGPGTGKTQILATRIANILKTTDTNPSSILALTFTESGAAAMRERLITLIGQTGYYVHISTFHAFCSDVISQNPEFFPLPSDASALTSLERFDILTQLIHNNPFDALKPINTPTYYVKSIISAISNLKREGLRPDDFEKILLLERENFGTLNLKKTEKMRAEKNLAKQTELLSVYRQYQDSLSTIGRYDFDDMIALVSKAFATEELLLLEYQEKYHYILVDEYQDTNGAQATVMHQLASYWGEKANLFVVGDINQSIYRFQGASAENVLSFLRTYTIAKVIFLSQNYRSTQTILDAASSLICNNQVRLDTLTGSTAKLVSNHHTGEKISLVTPASTQVETIYIAWRVRELINQGINPSEIAIIYRHNNDSIALSSALAKWGITYEIDGGVDIFTTPIIEQLLLLMSVIHGIQTGIEDVDLFTLLNYNWTGLDSLTILKLSRQASAQRKSLLNVIIEQSIPPSIEPSVTTQADGVSKTKSQLDATESISSKSSTFLHSSEDTAALTINAYLPQHFIYSNDENTKRIQEFVLQLVGLLSESHNHTFIHWFEYTLSVTGFLPFVLSRDTVIEDLNRINTLFNEIKRLSQTTPGFNLAAFLSTIAIMRDHGIPLTEEDLNITRNAVRLTTAHKAKGQEWDHVFLTTVIDKKWGNNRSVDLLPLPREIVTHQDLSKKDQNEDERRLFYVALTRARSSITISVPVTQLTNGTSKATVPSIFTTELSGEHVTRPSLENFESKQQELLETLISPKAVVEHTDEEKEFLQGILTTFKLSATSLNTYLECPYKFKLNHLLKVPRAKSVQQAYGTAIHKALESFFATLSSTGSRPSVEYLCTVFHDALTKKLLTSEQFTIRLQQGKKILSLYFEMYKDEFVKPLFIEKLFGFGWSKTYLDDIALTGKVDRIDWLDQHEKTVRIVDYKTGQPKSRNVIEGKTQHSDGSYKRQLVFYKLLTQLDRSFTAKAQEFMVDFVEPIKDSGKHKREVFFISQIEVDELQTLIRKSMKEIRALNFPRTNDAGICKDCEFYKHCWPEGKN